MTCFPGDIVSLEEQLCQEQYNATPLDSTRDFYSFTHFTKATLGKQKRRMQPLKSGQFSLPALLRMCSRRPNGVHEVFFFFRAFGGDFL